MPSGFPFKVILILYATHAFVVKVENADKHRAVNQNHLNPLLLFTANISMCSLYLKCLLCNIKYIQICAYRATYACIILKDSVLLFIYIFLFCFFHVIRYKCYIDIIVEYFLIFFHT